MKKINFVYVKSSLLLLCLHCFLFNTLNGQVGVNILSPHPTAALQIETPGGSVRGLLTPSMTSANRISIAQGTLAPANGLIVYDIDHKMHYYYQSASARWISMAPLVLSTPANLTSTAPYSAITTPSSSTIFQLGINKQNPNKELDVIGNAAISGSLSVNSNLSVSGSVSVNGFSPNALVPSGAIIMFNSSIAPPGWAICNGSNGTPDLRGRFIVASGQASSTPVAGDTNPNYAAGTKGGENFHTLSKTEIPKHCHAANADGATIAISGGAHTHAVTVKGQVQGLQRAGGGQGGVAGDGTETPTTTSSVHSHPTTEFSGKVGDGTTDGLNGQSHENRPQFYVLTFIMKL